MGKRDGNGKSPGARPSGGKADRVRKGKVKNRGTKSDKTKADKVKSGKAKSGRGSSGKAKSGKVKAGKVKTGGGGAGVKAGKKCCRSRPRCSRCPVLALLATRDRNRGNAERP